MNAFRQAVSAALLALACTPAAYAQTYPSRQIELILPAAPGGTTDTAVRLMAGKWQEFLGQPVLVVNIPGAGGVIGVNQVAKAKPDGYTIMGGFDSLLVALPFVQKTVEYNLDSFTYLNGFGLGALYFIARTDSPCKTIADLIDAAKRNPGKMTYSSYGVGVITHFTAERLFDLTGVKLIYVNLPGDEVYKIWKERQAWFRQTAPKMNLDTR